VLTLFPIFWFPKESVFKFDEGLFKKINAAYNSGDEKKLEEL
jgi:hypothetical protein